MALLTAKQIQITGTDVTPTAADAAGETFKPGDYTLTINNGSAVAVTATVAVPGNTLFGQPQPDVAVTVAAGAWKAIGPFPAGLADPADGLVHVTYDAAPAATVTRVLMRN